MEKLATEFNGILAAKLENGQYFDIDVRPSTNPVSFHISLATEKLNKNPLADIGLHIVVNLLDRTISAKTSLNKLETADFFIIDPNADIKVNILISEIFFCISINEIKKLKILYSDTSIIDKLNAIQIAGDIMAIQRVDHRKIFPNIWPPSACIPYYPHTMYFSNDIPIRLKPGHLIVMTGRCYGSEGGNFYINMKHGHSEEISMHFSVDFKDRIVYRSYLYFEAIERYAHRYSSNETDGGFPFDFDKPFKIGIACKENEFLMAVNGLYFCSFAHRDTELFLSEGYVEKPYTNILSNIVGVKVFSRHGAGIKITEIDHIQMASSDCAHFEKYTKNDCMCAKGSTCAQ